jgi:hypothetical protein
MIELMNDAQARVTAMSWHGGGGSELYSFGSSGAIPWDPTGLLAEISTARGEAGSAASHDALLALAKYIEVTPPRDPQPSWADLWDPDFEKSL